VNGIPTLTYTAINASGYLTGYGERKRGHGWGDIEGIEGGIEGEGIQGRRI
jgi:hypothetical protein